MILVSASSSYFTLAGIHTSCMCSPFSIGYAIWSLVFIFHATSSQRLHTAVIIMYVRVIYCVCVSFTVCARTILCVSLSLCVTFIIYVACSSAVFSLCRFCCCFVICTQWVLFDLSITSIYVHYLNVSLNLFTPSRLTNLSCHWFPFYPTMYIYYLHLNCIYYNQWN